MDRRTGDQSPRHGLLLGGQLFLIAALVPVERRTPDRERMRAVARRFGLGTLVAVAVLLASSAARSGEPMWPHRYPQGMV